MIARQINISVCICTHKRPEELSALLDSLARQTLPRDNFEIVIAENDENAAAHQIVLDFQKNHNNLTIHYQIETIRGVSYARNRAVKMARGQYLAFIDDDEEATPNWLHDLLNRIQHDKSDAIFGPVIPKYPDKTPRWIIESNFFARPRFVSGTLLRWNDTRTSNAMVLAKWCKDRNPYTFNPELALSGGEDTDFFRWMALKGAKFSWCDSAVVTEIVVPSRQNLKFMLERSFRHAVNYSRQEYTERNIWVRCLIAVGGILLGILKLIFGILILPGGLGATSRIWSGGFRAFGKLGALIPMRLKWYGQN